MADTEEMVVSIVTGEVFQLKPGDKIWVTIPKEFNDDLEFRKQVAKNVQIWAGPGVRIMIAPSGTEIKVVKNG